MTFNQLTEWYIDLEKVKALASYDIIKINLNKFNRVFGDRIISSIIPADLENYQMQRKAAGAADATIDHEIGKAKTMINKAFDNELVSGNTLRKFKALVRCSRRDPTSETGSYQRMSSMPSWPTCRGTSSQFSPWDITLGCAVVKSLASPGTRSI
jgi:hypothetical protein